MKSERLNASIRGSIVNEMMKLPNATTSKMSQELSHYIVEAMRKLTPQRILSIYDETPGIFDNTTSIDVFILLPADKRRYLQQKYGRHSLYIPHKYIYMKPLLGDEYEALCNDKQFTEQLYDLIVKFCDKLMENASMRNKITCVLDYIKTSNQLQAHFPEAYKIYVSLRNKFVNSKDECTEVEQVRAEYSKIVSNGSRL